MGATGAVGTELVRSLLASPRVGRVIALGRRPVEIAGAAQGSEGPRGSASRLINHSVDVFDPVSYENLLAGNPAAFCTLGLGQPSKVAREELYRVDVAAPAAFAAACKRQGVAHFSLLTAVGADSASRFHYLHCKGEVEDRVRAEGFARTSLFRPSMIMTPTNRYGLTQAITLIAYPWLDPFLIGPLRLYRSIKVAELGKAMALNAERPGSGVEILEWSGFRSILQASHALQSPA